MAFVRDRPGVPHAAVAIYVHNHVYPSATHALELWLFGKGWERSANEIGFMPLRRLIGIEGEIGARGYSRGRWFAIYMESGWIPRGGTMGRSTIWTRVPRLATTLRGKAIMLYLNIITGAPDHPAVGTIRCAAEWPGTWTERVEALIAALGIDADAWGHLIGEAGEERFTVGAAGVRAREAHKRKLRKIRDELVRPALRATDDAWIEELWQAIDASESAEAFASLLPCAFTALLLCVCAFA